MTVRTKVIGRQPTDHGEYNPNTSYGKEFQCTLFGCMWKSKHDNNNTAPAVWDGGDTITPNYVDWEKVSGDYEAWLMKLDKPAESQEYPFNGMGYVVLKKNVQDVGGTDKNLLTQDMFYKDGPNNTRVPNTNTIFEVRYGFELAEDVTIPSGSELRFVGGSIDGGGTTGSGNGHTVTFNNTTVTKQKNAFTNCRFAGSLATQQVFMSTFGVVADGVTDDSFIINDIIACAGTKHCEVVFDCDGDYGIGSVTNLTKIRFLSDTVYSFSGKGFLKLLYYSDGGTVTFINDADNTVINNIKIDGNYIYAGGSGQNGLSVHMTRNLRINGGVIKNCMRGEMANVGEEVVGPGDGGKGIQTELFGNQNLIIDGVSFFDCSIAISAKTDYASYDGVSFQPQNVKFSNIYAKNCETFLYCGAWQVGNNPVNPADICVTLENIIVEDCGWFKYGVTDGHHPNEYTGNDPANPNHSVYEDEGSVFCLDRAWNLSIINANVIGKKAAYNIIGGLHRNCRFENINVSQPCTSIISLDCGFFNHNYGEFYNNKYQFVLNCDFTYLFSKTGNNSNVKTIKYNSIEFVLYKYPSTTVFRGNIDAGYNNKLTLIPLTGTANFDKILIGVNWRLFLYTCVDGIIDNIPKLRVPDDATEFATIPDVFGNPMIYKTASDNFIPCWGLGSDPNTGTPYGYIEADGAERAISRSGSTALRQQQIGTRKPVGFVYLDTDIGKPCFWNGTKYVLADGTDAPTT